MMENNFLIRLYVVGFLMIVFSLGIFYKLFQIQFIDGDKYRKMAEDKTVKNFMNELTIGCICDPSIAICVCNTVESFKFANKKTYYPSNEEIKTTSRAKSATLRYVVKL